MTRAQWGFLSFILIYFIFLGFLEFSSHRKPCLGYAKNVLALERRRKNERIEWIPRARRGLGCPSDLFTSPVWPWDQRRGWDLGSAKTRSKAGGFHIWSLDKRLPPQLSREMGILSILQNRKWWLRWEIRQPQGDSDRSEPGLGFWPLTSKLSLPPLTSPLIMQLLGFQWAQFSSDLSPFAGTLEYMNLARGTLLLGLPIVTTIWEELYTPAWGEFRSVH